MAELFLDTSQSHLILALKTLQGWHERILAHHNELGCLLASSVDELLKKAHITYNELTQITVGAGPGSYTGTRVGVAFAESLGYGLNIPVIKIPSLIFYLLAQETDLLLKSNFHTYGSIKVTGKTWTYELLGEPNLPVPLPRLLDPKALILNPNWELITELKPLTPLKSILYFNLN